ncbi:hypothetical protein B0B52_06765 [Polaromonas sp. A23]|nr:hypothetical protein B0B52_06765 [Polaromonas sp. A23]
MRMENLGRYTDIVRDTDLVTRSGRVSDCHGLIIESVGPLAHIGEICEIQPQFTDLPVQAEVVGLRAGKVLLMPYSDLRGVGGGSEVVARGQSPGICVGDGLLGRVIDAFGKPMDSKGPIASEKNYPIRPHPINPLSRLPIKDVVHTGVKAVDGFLTIGKGQRIGIFSGSGVGKSTLLGMIARNVDCDLAVIALVGERGREVPEFIEKNLGERGLQRSVVVVATSDQPALTRTRAAFAATAIAEYFRDRGKNVLLIMDSVTRFAMAQREIGLAIGEPPTARGYTPSVFSLLPALLERCGTSISGGSITALYTVLMEGDDPHDIMVDTLRSILDGHIVLSREQANHGQYPAIDLLASISRLMPVIISGEEYQLVQRALSLLGTYQRNRDMVELGAYKAGTNVEIDRAIQFFPKIQELLCQGRDVAVSRQQVIANLSSILA